MKYQPLKLLLLGLLWPSSWSCVAQRPRTCPRWAPCPAVEQDPLDDEARVMAFVQCMREEGIKFKDPVMDADSNVPSLDVVEGVTC